MLFTKLSSSFFFEPPNHVFMRVMMKREKYRLRFCHEFHYSSDILKNGDMRGGSFVNTIVFGAMHVIIYISSLCCFVK